MRLIKPIHPGSTLQHNRERTEETHRTRHRPRTSKPRARRTATRPAGITIARAISTVAPSASISGDVDSLVPKTEKLPLTSSQQLPALLAAKHGAVSSNAGRHSQKLSAPLAAMVGGGDLGRIVATSGAARSADGDGLKQRRWRGIEAAPTVDGL